jgi:hypothetical protein
MHNMLHMQNMLLCIFLVDEHSFHILRIWWHMMHKTGTSGHSASEKIKHHTGSHISLLRSPNGPTVHRAQMRILNCHLYLRNCSNPIARSKCSSGRQEFPTVHFSSGLIISGSSRYFFFSQSIRWLTLGLKHTNIPKFLWRTGNSVNLPCYTDSLYLSWII